MEDNEINEFREKISQQEEIIQKLSKELDDEKFINNQTKEYLFVLQNRISKKDKKIKAQQKKIKKQNKKLKKLKNENQILKNSTSWKLTAPFRKIMNFIKN